MPAQSIDTRRSSSRYKRSCHNNPPLAVDGKGVGLIGGPEEVGSHLAVGTKGGVKAAVGIVTHQGESVTGHQRRNTPATTIFPAVDGEGVGPICVHLRQSRWYLATGAEGSVKVARCNLRIARRREYTPTTISLYRHQRSIRFFSPFDRTSSRFSRSPSHLIPRLL